MRVSTIKKTFSLPAYIAKRLDEVSRHTGYTQSNIVLQALTGYLHSYEVEGSLEQWLEWLGKTSGMFGDDDRSGALPD